MNLLRRYGFFLLGVLLGLGAGVLIAWSIPQGQPINTSPASLRTDFKDQYRFMIAAAYTVTGDLGRAQARLTNLRDPDPLMALSEQAQRMAGQNLSVETVRTLANLSDALKARPTLPAQEASAAPAANLPNSTPSTDLPPKMQATPAPTATNPFAGAENPLPSPLPSATPRPANTPTPTLGAPFKLTNQSTACDEKRPGLLQVQLQNNVKEPIPGVELIITWFGGEEYFFTGLKNEISPGYADYALTRGVEYALSLSGGSTRVTGLIAPICTTAQGTPYPGSIRLEFQQP